jgi:putative transposase
MRRAFRYRLWTSASQERELGIMLETHRRLYNACLEQRKTAYQAEGRSVRYGEQSAWFKEERGTNPYFARLNFSSAQATLRRLDRSFQNFFRRVKQGAREPGYPRFKGRDRFHSIEYPKHGDGIRLTGDRLRVQHVGTVRVKLHRPVRGTIKTLRLKREADKWYLVVSCELPDVPVTPTDRPAVGIDVGLEAFLTTSDGRRFPNPRYLKTGLPKLRRVSRAVARKKQGGKNRRKAVGRLQRCHAKVANLRREHHHQTALSLVLAYGLIVVESLNILGMFRNGKLARAIADAAWGGFVSILKGKAESAGIRVVEVDPAGTSQECVCGREVRKELSDRWHECPACGLSQQRDQVSAQVILARGLARTGPARLNVDQRVKRAARSCRLQLAE